MLSYNSTLQILLFLLLLLVLSNSHGFRKPRRVTNKSSKNGFKFNEKFDKILEAQKELIQELTQIQKELIENQNIIQKELTESQSKTDMQIKELTQTENKTQKALLQLIGYNQNQDANLEYQLSRTIKTHLLSKVFIPEDCLTEVAQKKIYSPKTGEEVAEWDFIFKTDYSEISASDIMPNWPPHNTLILLEVKQIANLTDIFEKLVLRVSKTSDAINCKPEDCSSKKKIKEKLFYQRGVLSPNPKFLVAIGAQNINTTTAEEIASKGYLAIGPTGDDFQVIGSKGTPYKVFSSNFVDYIQYIM